MTSTTPSGSTTRRLGQYVYLRPSAVEEYKACHREVWPEVLAQIKDCGISDYSIFILPLDSPIRTSAAAGSQEQTLILFASFRWTGTDFEDDMRKMRENVVVQKWWEMTDGMQISPDGSRGSVHGGWWRDVESVFEV